MTMTSENQNIVICEEILTIKQVKRKRKSKTLPQKITSSFGISQWLSSFIGDECQEHLVLFCLNTKNEIVSYSKVHVGSLNQSIAHPRDIMQRALLSNAARILISHNHPRNNTQPSSQDDQFTNRIKNACSVMGIDLLDHIIVGDKNSTYYSYREEDKL